MKVVRQETARGQRNSRVGSLEVSHVALMPPTKVYKITPTGSKNVAAMMCTPVLVFD